MKKIYEFTLNKTEKIKKTETITNDKGEKVEQTKLVDEIVPHKYFIKRPSRSESDDAEIFRAATESEYIKRGVISASLLQKRLLNDGGILSDAEKKEYESSVEKFLKLQSEFTELNKIEDKNKTEEQKKQSTDLVDELTQLMNRMGELENSSSSLYNRTAESLARNKTCLYLSLMLSCEEKDGKNIPVFGEGDYEAKLKNYDIMEEKEDDFEYELIQKLLLICSLWYMGKATTKDEFDSAMAVFNNQSLFKANK